MTSLIGFMYRQGDEFGVPQGDMVTPVEELDVLQITKDFIQDNVIDGKVVIKPEVKPSVSGDSQEESIANKYKRVVIREYLDSLFQTNPDKHVRSVYRRNESDTTRRKLKPGARKPVLNRKEEQSATPAEIAKSEYRRMTNAIPPVDLYKHLENYIKNNYDSIRIACNDIYAEKPDFEYMLNIYGEFDNEEKYQNFIHKYQDTFSLEIRCARQNHWVVQTPCGANTEKLLMYNREHRILQQILETKEDEAKVGREMMNNRIRRLKEQNNEEAGPDDEKFTDNYRKSKAKELKKSGVQEISKIERQQLEIEKRYLNQFDKPSTDAENTPDTVEVRIFNYDTNKKNLSTSTFLTKSEKIDESKAGISSG
jgi:hypothetical protein